MAGIGIISENHGPCSPRSVDSELRRLGLGPGPALSVGGHPIHQKRFKSSAYSDKHTEGSFSYTASEPSQGMAAGVPQLSCVSPSPAILILQLESRVVVTQGGEGGKESPVPGEQRAPQTPAHVSAGISQTGMCSRGLGAGGAPARQPEDNV